MVTPTRLYCVSLGEGAETKALQKNTFLGMTFYEPRMVCLWASWPQVTGFLCHKQSLFQPTPDFKVKLRQLLRTSADRACQVACALCQAFLGLQISKGALEMRRTEGRMVSDTHIDRTQAAWRLKWRRSQERTPE